MSAVISLTTIPSRLSHIEPCIRSLECQGLPVYVWIQREVKRTGAVFDGNVPGFLDNCHVTVIDEMGPIAKLLPALDVADVIVIADDDMQYGKRWSWGLLDWHARLPDVALGYRGRVLRDRSYNHSQLVNNASKPMVVDIITSGKGALFERKHFDDGIFEEWHEWAMNDDLVVNAHLKRRGVKRVAVPLPRGCVVRTYDGVYQIDELWAENRHLNNKGLRAVGWWT